MMFSVELIFSLSLIWGFLFLLILRPIESTYLSILGFVALASTGSLFEIILGLDSKILIVAVPAVAFVVMVGVRRNLGRDYLVLLAGMTITALISFSSQVFTRLLGLSSIGFTDGHTIITRAQEIALGQVAIETGSKALKRGFGLSAVHAQGLEGEYLVGFMPLVFLSAVLASAHLIYERFSNKKVVFSSVLVLLPLSILIEAIARHIYLMNTHTLAWLITSVLLIQILRFRSSSEQEHKVSWTSLYLTFITIGLLRIDYVVVFSIFWLLFSFSLSKSHWIRVGLLLPASVLASGTWLLTVTEEFPFFGSVGLGTYLTLGVLLPLIVAKLISKSKNTHRLSGQLSWALLGLFSVVLIFRVSWGGSLWSLGINLFAGEGLWGAMPYFIGVLVLSAIWIRFVSDNGSSAFSRLFLIMLMLVMLTKTFDNFEVSDGLSGISRVGFGDSLNRSLVTFMPFLYLLTGYVHSYFDSAPTRKTKPASTKTS